MIVEMELEIKFNRPVDLGKDYVVPGEYNFEMNGKNYRFDFCYMERSVCAFNPSICTFHFKDLDRNEYPEFANVTAEDLKNITSIKELFVYLGEEGENDLDVDEIILIKFYTPYDEPYEYQVPQSLINEYNRMLKKEKLIYETKLSTPELKEKIMAQQLTFYSRFLDIPLEKLCGYDKEQLEILVDSTLVQMPDDILHEFELELTGGKAEE